MFRHLIADLPEKENLVLEASIGGVKMEDGKSPTFVMTIENRLGQVIYYRSVSFDEYVSGAKNWQEIFLGTHLTKKHFRKGAHVIKLYLWNKDGQEFHFNNFKVRLRKGNPFLYWSFGTHSESKIWICRGVATDEDK